MLDVPYSGLDVAGMTLWIIVGWLVSKKHGWTDDWRGCWSLASERSDRVQSALLAVVSRSLPTYLFHLFRVNTFPRHLSIFPAISWEDGVGGWVCALDEGSCILCHF